MSYVFPTINTNSASSRQPVLAATTTAQTLSTDFENGDIIDGITLSTGDRVLIKNQVSGVENGIYEVQATGAPVRTSDFYTGQSAGGITITVTEGTVNDDTLWLCTTDPPNDIIGTDALAFVRSAGLGANGDVTGPASSTVNTIPVFLDTTGKALAGTGIAIDGSNNLSGVASLVLEAGANDVTLSASAQTVGASTITIPDLAGTSGDAIISNATQTLTNKTLTAPVIATISNGGGTLTLPSGVTDTLVARTTTDTLTNKTLTAPVIATISNGGGTLTLPSGVTDTLVARATADTLTNKTMNALNNTFSGFRHGTEVDEPSSGVHGVTGTIVGTSDTQTLTNKTLTSPRVGTSILDTNGNELLNVTATASAVNELTLSNAATGTDPILAATGGDTDVGIALQTKGAATVSIGSASATDSGILEILDDTGGESVSLTVPAALSGTYTLTLPDGVGTSGQVLSTDGNNPAVLTWIDSGGTTINEVTSITEFQSTDDNYLTIPDMTITPGAGTYSVSFSASNAVDNRNTTYKVAIFSNGTIVQYSERDRSHANANSFTSTQTQCEVTVADAQAIDVRIQRTAGNGSIIMGNRSLLLIS